MLSFKSYTNETYQKLTYQKSYAQLIFCPIILQLCKRPQLISLKSSGKSVILNVINKLDILNIN